MKDDVYLIELRKKDHNGFRKQVQYVGNLRDKPKGWRVVRYLGKTGEIQSGLVYS